MRKQFVEHLFNISQKLYTKAFKKHDAWNITKEQLLKYPKSTFGCELGKFLQKNNFELIAKVERHDAYHTLTGFKTMVEDEIALQYLCFGNGKRSPYMFGAILLGTFILPEYVKYYLKAYDIGKKANSFHNYDYKNLLKVNFRDFKDSIFSINLQNQLNTIQNE